MSNEIGFHFSSGLNLYRTIRKTGGQIWNVTAVANFEAYSGANWTAAKYCPALTDRSGGFYEGDWPASANMPAGTYELQIRLCMGANPVETDDPIIWSGSVEWDGTTLATLHAVKAVTDKLDTLIEVVP